MHIQTWFTIIKFYIHPLSTPSLTPQNAAPDVVKVLAGNKCECNPPQRAVDKERGEKVRGNRYDTPLSILTCSYLVEELIEIYKMHLCGEGNEGRWEERFTNSFANEWLHSLAFKCNYAWNFLSLQQKDLIFINIL